jgi:hypothetical protein
MKTNPTSTLMMILGAAATPFLGACSSGSGRVAWERQPTDHTLVARQTKTISTVDGGSVIERQLRDHTVVARRTKTISTVDGLSVIDRPLAISERERQRRSLAAF